MKRVNDVTAASPVNHPFNRKHKSRFIKSSTVSLDFKPLTKRFYPNEIKLVILGQKEWVTG